MHRCGSSQGNNNIVGPCSCGLMFQSQSNSFSMFMSMHTDHHYKSSFDIHEADVYSLTSSPSSSVDCTLSLGTPSTRMSTEGGEKLIRSHERRSSGSNCVSNFCLDLLHTKHTPPSSKSSVGRRGNNISSSSSDPLLSRRCSNCDTTSTPLWRNGPRGPKSLCNACGIRFKKEERRAFAGGTTTASNGTASGTVTESNYMFGNNTNSWTANHSQTQKIECFCPAVNGEFRFIEEENTRGETDTGISFLPWRLNVPDRPSLLLDFTR